MACSDLTFLCIVCSLGITDDFLFGSVSPNSCFLPFSVYYGMTFNKYQLDKSFHMVSSWLLGITEQ